MNICHLEELEDIQGVIKSRKLKKNRQCNGQTKRTKMRPSTVPPYLYGGPTEWPSKCI
jgi:hypothetical protein